MKIKLDHNLSPYLTEILKELGCDATTAREEGLSKASDALLLYKASLEERVLFTLDKGFADVDKYPLESHAGIVVFRQMPNEPIERVERRLIAFARSRSQRKIEGRTVVVEKSRIKFPRGKRKKSG